MEVTWLFAVICDVFKLFVCCSTCRTSWFMSDIWAAVQRTRHGYIHGDIISLQSVWIMDSHIVYRLRVYEPILWWGLGVTQGGWLYTSIQTNDWPQMIALNDTSISLPLTCTCNHIWSSIANQGWGDTGGWLYTDKWLAPNGSLAWHPPLSTPICTCNHIRVAK